MKLKEKYGLVTAISLIIGIMIGSGIFFKSDDVLRAVDGDVFLGVCVFLLAGGAMIFGATVFSKLSTKIEANNGLIDYSEKACGKKFSFMVGWFFATFYCPTILAILAWILSIYTLQVFGISADPSSLQTSILLYVLMFGYIIAVYVVNLVAPMIGAKISVSTTVIKLIPLILVGVFILAYGLITGDAQTHLTETATVVSDSTDKGVFAGILSIIFALDSWYIISSINGEIKNAKRNVPLAFLIGTFSVLIIYILYFIGLSSILGPNEIIAVGDGAPVAAAEKMFGNIGSTLFSVVLVISVFGTLNGFMITGMRSFYSLSQKEDITILNKLGEVNKHDVPTYSGIITLILTILFAFGIVLMEQTSMKFLDYSEAYIFLTYMLLVIIYIWVMISQKDFSIVHRFVIPSLAIVFTSFVIIGAVTNTNFVTYMILNLAVLLPGVVVLLLNYKRT